MVIIRKMEPSEAKMAKKIAQKAFKGIESIFVGTLYEKTTCYLWEEGCAGLTGVVKDDNVGSWKLFLNNGFSRASLSEGVRQLGLRAMILQYFTTPLFISNGMDFYIAVKDGEVQPKSSSSMNQMCFYMLANILLMLAALAVDHRDFPKYLCAFITLLLGGVIFEYIGTLFSKKRWTFRLNNGGAALVGFLNFIGGIYPMNI